MAQRIYRITALVRAQYETAVGSDALSSGIMGAFEPNTPFELISHNVEPDATRAETLDELADLMSDAIDDSMDMDWRSADGARAIVNMLAREGYSVVMRGEDSEVAIAIGKEAFDAGYNSAAQRAVDFAPTVVRDWAAHREAAWSEYKPSEDLCGRALCSRRYSHGFVRSLSRRRRRSSYHGIERRGFAAPSNIWRGCRLTITDSSVRRKVNGIIPLRLRTPIASTHTKKRKRRRRLMTDRTASKAEAASIRCEDDARALRPA